MQPVSSRIWTRVAVFISYDDNNYTTGTSQKVCNSTTGVQTPSLQGPALNHYAMGTPQTKEFNLYTNFLDKLNHQLDLFWFSLVSLFNDLSTFTFVEKQ